MSVCNCSAFYLRGWLLGALSLLAAMQLSCADCPKSCVCHIPTEVHCTFRYLTTVPDHFPPDVERINLGYNGITFLRESDFLRLEKLQLLMLHRNTMHSIEDRAFRDLRSLQVLKMSHNEIKEVNKEMFKCLTNLQRLHIDHNQIQFINPEAFYGLTNLQLVQLEGNQLQQLHPDTFITLRHSQIFKVSSLRTIHLSDNLLSTLPADIFLGCSQLENLYLHGNPWRCDCRMKWFSFWTHRNTGVLKCKRDRQGQLCPVCETPAPHRSQPLFILHQDAFTCTKPWINSHLKQKNVSLEEGDFIPVYPKDFIAPLGTIQMNLTDQFYKDTSLMCTVQTPTAFENLTQTATEDKEKNVTGLTTGITTYLVCNVDHEDIQQLWQIMASYSDSPLRLERGIMLARTPEMVYRYSQKKDGDKEITTNIKADIKATPAWLMQGEVSLQLDRTTTTFSTLHIKYQSIVSLHLEAIPSKKDPFSWTMIKRDNQTKTEHTVITGGVTKLSCQIQGEPKPLMEWILPDGSKVRAPFYSEDRRIIISADGVLTLRGADASDTGLYWCIATNYLDADVLTFRITVLSVDVEESEINGLWLSKSVGENLKLDCSSSGSPEGSVSWILPDHSVLAKSQANRKVYENGTLLIQHLTARDRGFYRCLVANHLGIDLLVSQLMLSEERIEAVTALRSEGSSKLMDTKMDSSLEDHQVNLNENTSSALAEIMSQEFRTVTSAHPHPRVRLQGRGNSQGRIGQRRRGAGHNRHIWSSRMFGKASRRVDPHKFAEFMKKAHNGPIIKTSTINEIAKNDIRHPGSSGDEEIGSGGGYEEEHLIVATLTVKPTTETMEAYKESDSSQIKPMFTHLPSQFETTEFYPLERTSRPPPNLDHVTLQLSRTDNKKVTQLKFLGEQTAERETATEVAIQSTTDPNLTPILDDLDPVGLVLHTDTESQMTFTAITTTYKEKDRITFHTTQTIKSPQLSAGSTIISQQQIQIIPRKSNRGKGGRRTPYGRRRLIKPNRINDIQHFINRFKQPTVKKEENTTDCDCDENRKAWTTHVQLSTPTPSSTSFLSKTEKPTSTQTATSPTNRYITANAPFRRDQSRSEASTEYIASAEAPEIDPTIDAFLPCEAIGNPHPVTTWKHFTITGKTITISEKMGKFEVLNNGTLTIKNANIKDQGQYLCLAENDHGSDKLLVTLSVVAYPSRILEPKMREMKSHTGDRVEMKCKAEGRPLPMISWILANRTQVRGQNTEKGRVLVSSDGTLIINHVSIYDRGYYKCIASNPAGADTAAVRLQVVAAPPGIVEQKRQQLKARLRQNLWLSCTSYGTPHPSIHWVLHDGTVVRSNKHTSEKRISVFENGTLFIKDVNPEDKGKYECIATSSTGSERRVVTLSVEKQEYPPEIVKTSQNMTELSFGDQLRLNCLATGDPKPRILWRLPSKAVADHWHRIGSRIQVLDNGTLVVNTVSDKDAGDYLCVAQNTIGDDLQLMRVIVSMKPAKIEPKFNRKKQVHYGKDLKVDCKASGAPKPEISWGLPDGTVVNSGLQADAGHGGGQTRRYTLFQNGTLYLNQVSPSEEGDYTCYAENQVGKDEMHVHITVVATAPRIRPPSQTYARVKPGENIRFDCETFGEPKPKILWRLPNNDVIAASNERYLIHVNGSLDIRDVKLIDAGEYVCMARNPGGENRKVYKLDIDGNPPVINGYHQNRTVIKDVALKHSRKLLDCIAEGDPTPTITWIMPDNIFLSTPYFGSRINVHLNGTLEIRNVRPSDTAEFICLARNDRGEAVMVVQLEVTNMLRRPIFRNPFNERLVSQIGKTAILNCSADGQPMPEIIWTLPNGTQITSGSRRSSRHQPGDDGTLVIYSSREEDSGKYRCGARNLLGYIEKLIILNIGEKPYIFTRPKGIIRSISGEPLYLHCLSDGSPRPRIYWTIPGGHTFTQPQILGRYHLLENGTLVVHDSSIHDKGNYICRAHNNAGEAQITVPVFVIAYPPRITTGPPPRLRALSGTPLKLNCAATGIPKPEINWELPDNSILSAAKQGRPMGSELFHPQGTLVIQKPSSSDSGQYKCLAKNYLEILLEFLTDCVESTPLTFSRYLRQSIFAPLFKKSQNKVGRRTKRRFRVWLEFVPLVAKHSRIEVLAASCLSTPHGNQWNKSHLSPSKPESSSTT
ncbi:hypothetical protein CRENBAI_001345 [Crenichthys baileyi]|uniref:Ig-like domain-containing protein n=1 Tax=Crenichthys baileyi TaxID=28760 RepID=A0AAV9QVZ9_9TELE